MEPLEYVDYIIDGPLFPLMVNNLSFAYWETTCWLTLLSSMTPSIFLLSIVLFTITLKVFPIKMKRYKTIGHLCWIPFQIGKVDNGMRLTFTTTSTSKNKMQTMCMNSLAIPKVSIIPNKKSQKTLLYALGKSNLNNTILCFIHLAQSNDSYRRRTFSKV